MIEQDGKKWYRPTEYADMYGKSRQSVNGLIERGTLQTRTIHGKTHVSGMPPYGWKRVPPQEALFNKLFHMHPFDFLWDEETEEPHPKDEPFPGAWKLAKDVPWRYVVWAGAKLKNDPEKAAMFFRIMDAEESAYSEALIQRKEQNPYQMVFEYYFIERLFKILNGMEPRKGNETN